MGRLVADDLDLEPGDGRDRRGPVERLGVRGGRGQPPQTRMLVVVGRDDGAPCVGRTRAVVYCAPCRATNSSIEPVLLGRRRLLELEDVAIQLEADGAPLGSPRRSQLRIPDTMVHR